MPDTTPSTFLPLNEARALIHAAAWGNMEEIDAITDRLAQQGVCRPRSDMSRMAEWIAMRPPEAKPLTTYTDTVVTEDGKTDIGATMAAHFRGIFVGAAQ